MSINTTSFVGFRVEYATGKYCFYKPSELLYLRTWQQQVRIDGLYSTPQPGFAHSVVAHCPTDLVDGKTVAAKGIPLYAGPANLNKTIIGD